MFGWIDKIVDAFSPSEAELEKQRLAQEEEERQKHAADEELRRKTDAENSDSALKEAIDPADPTSTPSSRDADVRDEVLRALAEARGEVAEKGGNLRNLQADELEDLKNRMVSGANDTGVIALNLEQQAEIQAEIQRLGTTHAGIAPAGAEAEEGADNLHPNLAASREDSQRKNKAWAAHPSGFLGQKMLDGKPE
jgi:hypothetical protein